MKWNFEGFPEPWVWCLLDVRELKNTFGWTGPVTGAWDGAKWIIRQYAPDMRGGSFINAPAGENLEVLAWCVISAPRRQS